MNSMYVVPIYIYMIYLYTVFIKTLPSPHRVLLPASSPLLSRSLGSTGRRAAGCRAFTVQNQLRACSVIFNPYGLEGIDMDWRGF
jgi:hypothetical protein